MIHTTPLSRIIISPAQEEALHFVLRKILSSTTKTTSGKQIAASLRIELESDQHEALMMVFAQL
jgi:hypothetical protein